MLRLSEFHDSQPFDIGLLLFPGIVLFLSLFAICYLGSKSFAIAGFIAAVKTALFTLYFGVFFDGTYTSLDDENYLATGQQLYQLFLTEGIGGIGILQVQNVVGGAHIIYNAINAIACLFFGEYYFSPIVINIIVSALAAALGVAIVRQQKIIPETELRCFFLFFCLHPELVSWSTVFNGKDTLVLLMNVLLLYAVSLFALRRTVAAFSVGLIATLVLLNLRNYVPLVFSVSFLVYRVIGRRPKFKEVFCFVIFGILFLAFAAPWGSFGYLANLYADSFMNPLTGAVHFMLTPRPFSTDEIHGFLNFASLVNWILFPVFLIGIYVGVKLRNRFIDFLLFYLLSFVMLYAGFYDLNGPRHRLPLLLAISIFQFIGLRWLLGKIFIFEGQRRPQGNPSGVVGALSP